MTEPSVASGEKRLYTPTWTCCVCLGELGFSSQFVPCVNARCPEHNVCYLCAERLPRSNGVALCPVCRAPCAEFVPLPSLVDEARDPAAAEMLRAVKRRRTAGAAPVAAQPRAPMRTPAASGADDPAQQALLRKDRTPSRPSVIPPTIAPEVVPPWNAPHLRAARRADLQVTIREMRRRQKRSDSYCNYVWEEAVAAYDVPYILRDAQGEPLSMRQQTTLHAIQADALADLQPLFNDCTLTPYRGFEPDWPGVYYVLYRIQSRVPEPGFFMSSGGFPERGLSPVAADDGA